MAALGIVKLNLQRSGIKLGLDRTVNLRKQQLEAEHKCPV